MTSRVTLVQVIVILMHAKLTVAYRLASMDPMAALLLTIDYVGGTATIIAMACGVFIDLALIVMPTCYDN